ncbi:MAG: hypothetical protein U1G07_21030 [Verrucomicrobiota bacterium]
MPTSLRDEGLVNDVAVTYRVVAVYPHAAAQGVLVAGIPFCPPKPCAWSVENQSGPALTVSWAQPERGEAKLLLSETALVEGLHPSEVAQAFGQAIPSRRPGAAAVTLPQPGRWYLTLCVVLRNRAWVSALGRYLGGTGSGFEAGAPIAMESWPFNGNGRPAMKEPPRFRTDRPAR